MAGAGTAYPADYSATYTGPVFTATQGRTALAAAMGGATAARPLGGTSGVRPGTPASIVTVTSTTWTVTPFGGYTDLETSATNGGYFFSFQAASTGAVTAAVGSARTDILYVQIADVNTSDGTTVAPRVILDYVSNYPTNALPARSFILATLNVPASGGGSPTVTWSAPACVAAGGIWPVATQALLFAAAGYVGQAAYVTSDTTAAHNGMYVCTVAGAAGSATWVGLGVWSTFTPAWTGAGSNPSIGNGTLVARYAWLGGKTYALRYSITFGSTSTGGGGVWALGLPAGLTAGAGEQELVAKAYLSGPSLNYVGVAPLAGGGTSFNVLMPGSSTSVPLTAVQNANNAGAVATGVPLVASAYSFTNGSNLQVNGIIEVA